MRSSNGSTRISPRYPSWAISGIGGTIGSFSEIANAIAAAVTEQSAATQEIARNVQEASAGVTEVNTHMTSVSSAAENTGGAADKMLVSIRGMVKQSDTLKQHVENFLTRLKAA